jgi:hypothetical protein
MPVNARLRRLSFLLVCAIFVFAKATPVFAAGQYLVADRTLGRVLRYSEGGDFLGTLLHDPTLGSGLGTNDGGITGLILSPDETRLYVSDRLSNRVAVYGYAGTSATHLFDITAFSAFPSTLYVPGGMLFSQDGLKLHVSNLGPFNAFQLPAGDTVAQLTPLGTTAGLDLTGGPQVGRTGLAFNTSGELLVSAFNAVGSGSVLRFDSGSNQFVDFISPRPELRGAANLLVVGDDLYVAAGYGGRVGKFDANTGALDTSFSGDGYLGPGVDFAFPASLALGPDRDSILVGILGATTGDSRIEEYDFDGNSLGVWATNAHTTNFPPGGTGTIPSNNILGFSEPTGIVFSTFVPEPSSGAFLAMGLATMAALRRIRTARSVAGSTEPGLPAISCR